MLTDKSLRRLILQTLYDKDVCTAEAFIDALIDARGVCSRMQLLKKPARRSVRIQKAGDHLRPPHHHATSGAWLA